MLAPDEVSKVSIRNRVAIEQSIVIGCYACIRSFLAEDVQEWTDDQTTALCPFCGIDAVLPGIFDAKVLATYNERWFTGLPALDDEKAQT